MLRKIGRFFLRLKNSIRHPIFRRQSARCEPMHEWTVLQSVLGSDERERFHKLCQEHPIEPLVSLVKGNLICRKCGQIASYNVNINIDNLVFNLRAFDA